MNENSMDGIVFVFGSNLLGIHGAGAAKDAAKHWGAKAGIGFGPHGASFAIPTCLIPGNPLSLVLIAWYVSRFIAYAEACPELEFQVTAIGCGIAGYDAYDIAPLFAEAPANCHLPLGWREIMQPYEAQARLDRALY